MNEQLEHDLICNTGTAIDRIKIEVQTLNEMIDSYETYTNNTLFLNNLNNLKQRMLNQINLLDKNFNSYVDLNEAKL